MRYFWGSKNYIYNSICFCLTSLKKSAINFMPNKKYNTLKGCKMYETNESVVELKSKTTKMKKLLLASGIFTAIALVYALFFYTPDPIPKGLQCESSFPENPLDKKGSNDKEKIFVSTDLMFFGSTKSKYVGYSFFTWNGANLFFTTNVMGDYLFCLPAKSPIAFSFVDGTSYIADGHNEIKCSQKSKGKDVHEAIGYFEIQLNSTLFKKMTLVDLTSISVYVNNKIQEMPILNGDTSNTLKNVTRCARTSIAKSIDYRNDFYLIDNNVDKFKD